MKRRVLPLPPLPSTAHLALADGSTHPGLLDDCASCRAYHDAHPGEPVPHGYPPPPEAA